MKIKISVKTAQTKSLVQFIAEIPDSELKGLDKEDRENVINDWAKCALLESDAWEWWHEVVSGSYRLTDGKEKKK